MTTVPGALLTGQSKVLESQVVPVFTYFLGSGRMAAACARKCRSSGANQLVAGDEITHRSTTIYSQCQKKAVGLVDGT